jgi:adenine-specific DNA-methyltransferase
MNNFLPGLFDNYDPLGQPVRVHEGKDWKLAHGRAEAFLPSLPSGTVDMVFTSPPYNLQKDYEKKRLSLAGYLGEMSYIVSHCVRVLKPGGSFCWQVGNTLTKRGVLVPLDCLFYSIFSSFTSLCLRNRIVWIFGHGEHYRRRFSGRHETLLWFTKGMDYDFHLDLVRVPAKYPNKKHFKGARKGQLSGNPLGKNPGDVWDIPNVKSNHCEKEKHPCQFPIALPRRMIRAATKPGAIILDPFVGSGTVILAALLEGRIGWGCERDGEYVSLTLDRIDRWSRGDLVFRGDEAPKDC